MPKSLYDFGQSIIRIREAANSMEIKGRQNASFVVYINNKCDELIEEINEIARDAEKPAPESTSSEETDGDLNEQNSGSPQ